MSRGRLLEFLAVLARLSATLQPDAARDWLFTPNPLLGHHKPADAKRVLDLRPPTARSTVLLPDAALRGNDPTRCQAVGDLGLEGILALRRPASATCWCCLRPNWLRPMSFVEPIAVHRWSSGP